MNQKKLSFMYANQCVHFVGFTIFFYKFNTPMSDSNRPSLKYISVSLQIGLILIFQVVLLFKFYPRIKSLKVIINY